MAKEQVGIIGCGKIAGAYYLPVLRQMGYDRIMSFDADPAQHVLFSGTYHTTPADLEALKQACDLIIITTPPSGHFELLKQCISKHKTIICEKPFVLRGAEARLITVMAEERNCNVYIAHLRRTFSSITLAKGFLAQQPYGKLLRAEIFEGGIFHYKTTSGYITGDPYGGVLYDTGSHALDCLLYINGMENTPVETTVSRIEKSSAEPSHEWSGDFMLNDIHVKMKLSRQEALGNKMNLYFEKGIVEVPLSLKSSIRIREGEKSGMLKSDSGIINFYAEAFRMELREILQKKNKAKFSAEHFVQLSFILEKLYDHL